MESVSRREVFATGLAAAGAASLGPYAFERVLARPARPGPGPYGPLAAPDANGIMLPEGFSSRLIARGQSPVGQTGYVWHVFSDGAATFGTGDGGWILVSNAEVPIALDLVEENPALGSIAGNPGDGGASAIRFDHRGRIVDAYSILAGTSTNCAGGSTPWGTWLSCEEHERGLVWECDPTGQRQAVARPPLGRFTHEAACVDPKTSFVYLTEDDGDGGFYRFIPERRGDLSSGLLQIAEKRRGGQIRWHDVPDPSAGLRPTRSQVPRSTRFKRGEGIWFNRGYVYVATTRDSKIHRYNARRNVMRVVYNPEWMANAPLTDVDNITVHPRSGDLFACEDNGGDDPYDIALLARGHRGISRFAKLTGDEHGRDPHAEYASEVVGVCFDPSGTRMYFASQRAFGFGAVYEVSGPFRQKRWRHRARGHKKRR